MRLGDPIPQARFAGSRAALYYNGISHRSASFSTKHSASMMKRTILAVADIYVPVKRRATIDPQRMDEIAASILEKGLRGDPRTGDGARSVLGEDIDRLEAASARRTRFPCRGTEALTHDVVCCESYPRTHCAFCFISSESFPALLSLT
jgi:sulfiredoxin